jgi:hypothetical protein
VLGDVRVRRAADRCPSSGVPALPRADQRGLPTERTSPLLRARRSRFGAVAPFAEACACLAEASGGPVSAKRAQRVSDEVGARREAQQAATPPGETEPAGARGSIGIDGVFSGPTARDAQQALLWREAKVGVIAFPLP